MRARPIGILAAMMIVAFGASSSYATTLDGTVKVGGIILDEEGDRSAVQETYDVYDGFAVSQVRRVHSWQSRGQRRSDPFSRFPSISVG